MYYNDLLDRQNSGWDSDKVTYFYVGDIFGLYLDSMYADSKEKSLHRFLGKCSKLFIVSTINFTTMKSLELFPRNFSLDFFF